MADRKESWFKRHKIITVIVALILGGIVASAAGSSGDKKETTAASSDTKTATKAKEKQPAKIGTAVRDGKFEFTVNSVTCGKTTAGTNQYLQKTAQGQYCYVAVTVKNVGNEAQGLFSSNQKLLNAQKQEYAADDTATLYAAPDNGSAYNSINPGNSIEATIVFDIPKDQTPTSAELHDSAFSGGVSVNLQ